ncbi:transcriptional regulator [Carboxylicivirga mesophila]|uniref:Transcriptional regulator n=2 Tax=Carboxylicivirga TaxID=1628153 RepID=A0A941IXQ9_9BACT|nr:MULTISPECIES: transcriptional regulator [Carboxylicivirga]MBR8535813.1 transcriptional regulator [Carboxylicivirga sediminis]MBS2212210.1 transcriptional regulator [Carboxylicivirga mesophila]
MKHIIDNLSKLFDSRLRLGIMAVLMVNDKVDFNALKEYLDASDGNLASHIKALEKHDLIIVHKQFVGRKPKTSYEATPLGRQLFQKHLDGLNNLISNVKQ